MVEEARGPQVLHRALDVLELLTPEAPELRLRDVTRGLGLSPATAHRLVRALEQRGYLALNPATRSYSVGPGVLRLAQVATNGGNDATLRAVAAPVLERLRDRTGETVGLHVRRGRERVCVEECESRHPIRMSTGVGATQHLGRGAAGKVLLAWEATVLVDSYRPAGRQAARRFVDELSAVRRSGYATSFGETVEGAAALALPVFDAASTVVAAINVTGPAARWTPGEMALVRAELASVVHGISARLGYAGEMAS